MGDSSRSGIGMVCGTAVRCRVYIRRFVFHVSCSYHVTSCLGLVGWIGRRVGHIFVCIGTEQGAKRGGGAGGGEQEREGAKFGRFFFGSLGAHTTWSLAWQLHSWIHSSLPSGNSTKLIVNIYIGNASWFGREGKERKGWGY